MNDERQGESGAANTPPFPRISSRPGERRPIESEPPVHPPEPLPASAEASGPESPSATPGTRPPDVADAAAERAAEADPEQPVDAESGRMDDFIDDAAQQARKVRRTFNRAFGRVADQLEELAVQLEQVADAQLRPLGAGNRAVQLAHAGADFLGDAADYLRDSDLRSVRGDLERQVREKPFPTLLVALGAGWLLGKIMR